MWLRGACVLLLCVLARARHDDDFAFDNGDEFQVGISNNSESTIGLKRLWGIPDTSAYVGHLFRMEIPNEAFSGGDVIAYKVRGADGRRAPAWLAVDSRHGLVSGVPLAQDAGAHTLLVTAHAHNSLATDTFTIEVKKSSDKPHSRYGACGAAESKLSLLLLLDVRLHQLKPKQRTRALMHLANFMALDGDEFSIESFKSWTGAHGNQTVLQSGPGSSQRRRGEATTTAIYLSVGCGGKMWPRHKVLVAGMREQARDGTLAHILELPVLGWRLMAEKPRPVLTRPRRQLPDEGSGAYYDEDDGEGDYSGYDDDDDEDYDFGTPIKLDAVTPGTPPPPPHPHRHHHGAGLRPDPDLTSPHLTFVSSALDKTPPTASPPPTAPASPTTAPTQPTPPAPTAPTTPPTPAPAPTAPRDAFTVPELTSTALATAAERSSTLEEAATATAEILSPIPSPATFPYPSPPVERTEAPATPAAPATPGAAEDAASAPPPTQPTLTTNATLHETDKRVEIIPSEAGVASTRSTANATSPSVNRNLDLPVVIVPDNSITSTERTTPSGSASGGGSGLSLSLTEDKLRAEMATQDGAPTVLIQASSESQPPATEPSDPPTTPVPTPPTVAVSTTTASTTTTVTAPDTTVEVTRQDTPPSTEKSSTIIGRTTETIDFHMPVSPPLNQPPQLSYHMKKLAVTAGKAFRYLIPFDLFTDTEEGTNLTYTMYEADNAPLKSTSWVQFMPDKKEVYGLPLEEHVSRWGFTVQAADSAGAAARAPLDIIVQHHKGQRTLNHQFSITLKVQHKYQYAIDWQIHVLEGLVNLFRNTDMDHIIVRNVSTHGDLVEFVWSDDTLAKDTCPTADIQRLMAILESDSEKGSPSANLSRVMLPQLKVSSVGWTGLGTCAATPAPPPAPPPHLDTFPPVPRNQVDLVQATAGHLLVFKVPQDTFYDPEDGGTRRLKLSVIRGDRSPLPSAHWMQFDQANQEFYGLPTERDIGKKEYQLIAEDSTGKTANDVLLVEVNPAPQIQPPVEFQMTMNYPYSALAGSALAKRTFLESLAKLFGDKDASSIRVKSITDKPTTVIWFNTSLPMDRCPNDRIEELKRIIIKEEQQGSPESLTDQVDLIFDKHDVMSIRLIPRNQCAHQSTLHSKTTSNVHHMVPSTEHETKSVNMQEYIVTFIIPAIVVVCMILIAGVIACVLYRRRRTGKMSVGDEEERQAFRSRGIPVIFQDELEEKPDPSNKSPVIMKEEKPPLLPPPDYKPDADSPTPSHHTPYRPPPPFTASRDPRPTARPKATPTYRKPPPYVPP